MIWNRKKPYLAKILRSKLLSSKVSNKEVIHYEIALGDSGICYEPGDSLGVIPVNDHNLIEASKDLGGNSIKTFFLITLSSSPIADSTSIIAILGSEFARVINV